MQDLDCLINYSFAGAPTPVPIWIADVNGDAVASNVLDVAYMTDYLIREGPDLKCNQSLFPTPSPSPTASILPVGPIPSPTRPPSGIVSNPCIEGPCRPSPSPLPSVVPTSVAGNANATVSPSPSPKAASPTPKISPSPSPTVPTFTFTSVTPGPVTGLFSLGSGPWEWIIGLIMLLLILLLLMGKKDN